MSGPPSRLSSTIRFRPEAGRSAQMQYVPNFRPEQAGNITLWLDASEYSTFAFIRPNEVLTWQDKKTPQKNFVLQSTQNPLYNATGFNGLPTVVFGQNKGLKNNAATPYTLTSNDALTIFIVGKLNTTPSQRALMFRIAKAYTVGEGQVPIPLDVGSDPSNFFYWYGTFDLPLFSDSANNQMVSNPSPTVVCFNLPAGSSYEKLYLNADAAYSQSLQQRTGTNSLSVQADFVFIGTNGAPGFSEEYWDGCISEVLVYDTSLSDSDTAKVAGYLGQKWGFKDILTTPYDSQTVYRPVTQGPLFSLRNAQM